MDHGAYTPVGERDNSCRANSQRFVLVLCCVGTFLFVGTVCMMHVAPATHGQLAGHAEVAQSWAQTAYNDHLAGHVDAAHNWAKTAYNDHLAGHVDAAHNWAQTAYNDHLAGHVGAAQGWASQAYSDHLQHHVESVADHLTGRQYDQILHPYDCTSNDRSVWSNAHQVWCCEHKEVGCTTTAAPEPPQKYMWMSFPQKPPKYDCAAGIENWQKGWSERKMTWCCSEKGIGCKDALSKPFDCQDVHDAHGWTMRKKLWCCLEEERGCPKEQAPERFNCDEGLSNWQEGWSAAKQAWCCANHKRGCPGSETFDCQEGIEHWQRWTDPKKAFCCKTYALACPLDKPEPAAYDCDAGYANWRSGWSDEKKAWCCNKQSLGCYDCQEATEAWSFEQRSWCCWHHQRGCESQAAAHTGPWVQVREETHTALSMPFDCDAGFANWQAGWSEGKKMWCCRKHNKACGDVVQAGRETIE
ncbi:unnamed protein product [Effrenium voratum]|nr:unnamed protein product [Effrenium voratum]